jgi:hypothetical protein
VTENNEEEEIDHGKYCNCPDCWPGGDPYLDQQGFEEFNDGYDGSGEGE